jgi:hypothetical protein
MKKLTIITAITALTLSFASVAKADDDQSDWLYMKGGQVPTEVFQAIYNRCTQRGSTAYQSSVFGGFNYSLSSPGSMASISNALNNLQTVFKSQAAQDTEFNNCMAQHGFYPR